jgi:hypothetical protein
MMYFNNSLKTSLKDVPVVTIDSHDIDLYLK